MSDHTLLRLDILTQTYRRAHCSCGTHAYLYRHQAYAWIKAHRLFPHLSPAELANHIQYEGIPTSRKTWEKAGLTLDLKTIDSTFEDPLT